MGRWRLAEPGTTKVFDSRQPERRVYLSNGLFVNLTDAAAELVSSSADYHQSMRFTLPELNEIVGCALQACENNNQREIQVRDLTLKVDARLERIPKVSCRDCSFHWSHGGK